MTTSQNSSSRTWLITGASSGIGRALAEAVAARGENVVAIARAVDDLAPLVAAHDGRVRAEAADRAAVDRAVAAGLGAFGGLDVVVNNAGHLLVGAVEEAGDEQVRALFETGVHGVLNVLRATLPTLRAQGSGLVVQNSSFLGLASGAGMGHVAAVKHALEGLSDALADELAPLGVGVTIVEPGRTATPFFAKVQAGEPIADYDPTVRALMAKMAQLPAAAFDDPAIVVDAILAAADAETPPRRVPTGASALEAVRASLRARLAQVDAVAQVGA